MGDRALEVIAVGEHLQPVEIHRLHAAFAVGRSSGEGDDLGGLGQARFFVLLLDVIDDGPQVFAGDQVRQAGHGGLGHLKLGTVPLVGGGLGVKRDLAGGTHGRRSPRAAWGASTATASTGGMRLVWRHDCLNKLANYGYCHIIHLAKCGGTYASQINPRTIY